MARIGNDTLGTRQTLEVGAAKYEIFSLKKAAEKVGDISRLPYSLKVLMENLLRCEDGKTVKIEDIQALADWQKTGKSKHEISFRPTRVLMQDFTGVPAVVDLASMRDAVKTFDGDPDVINPLAPVDLVIDHSLSVEKFASKTSYEENTKIEFTRNKERYEFLKWAQVAFDNFRIVPPGMGICHQVNLENLAKVIWVEEGENAARFAYPDTVVGTDSHTTMIGGLAVLGWGVGGIEAEAGMLGQPNSMLIPEVVGVKLTGELSKGVTSTDLVLTIVEALRAKGVVGKFVEFCGEGLSTLSLADRATVANMAPEYGATCGFFPVDEQTIQYLEFTGRSKEQAQLVEEYSKQQGLWRENDEKEPIFTDTLVLDMGEIKPCIAGPKRPQDKILLENAAVEANKLLGEVKLTKVPNKDYEIDSGHVVIAAINSCTNTSNPNAMVTAGLVARKARQYGLNVQPWVKTSLSPGSQVVSAYLEKSGLQDDLNELGFNLVGYGCASCIGNSGPIDEDIVSAMESADLDLASVSSGNRNFEGRINPNAKANYLASPGLVVAYAIAGSVRKDIAKEPIGTSKDGKAVYLSDVWPSADEINAAVNAALSPEMFAEKYASVFDGTDEWKKIELKEGKTYAWDDNSTYIQSPPYFTGMKLNSNAKASDIVGARALAIVGDSVTTDHISPAGAIKSSSPAGEFLKKHGVEPKDFNSYGSRRGNHEIMMRGTFANVRFRNLMAPNTEGGVTKMQPSGEQMSIYDAAMKYQEQNTPLIVIAGKEYGTGSSRDWAAKGPRLLGVKAVIAKSFERIHRSNLIGMGVLPLEFSGDEDLGLDGTEEFDLTGITGAASLVGTTFKLTAKSTDGTTKSVEVISRIDTADEEKYYLGGGILHYVLRYLCS